MKILPFVSENLKVYATGNEEKYDGKLIHYKEGTKVLIYYYYKHYKIAYIVTDYERGVELPYIEGKVRIVVSFHRNISSRMRKLMKAVPADEKDRFFQQDDLFYHKLYLCLQIKNRDIKELIEFELRNIKG